MFKNKFLNLAYINFRKFKYFGYKLDKKEMGDPECGMKIVSGRKVAGANESLVNTKRLF